MTTDKLVTHRIGIMMYKFSNGLLPTVLNSLCQKNNEVHTYNTRAKICSTFLLRPNLNDYNVSIAFIWYFVSK